MPQSFRLRLGDGTILMVDHGGLSTWEADRTAAVGTKHPNKWIPLKEFLAQERAVAFRRARETARESSPADRPVTSRKDGLPLVPPPPPREPGAGPLDRPSSSPGEAPLATPPDGVESLKLPPPVEEPTPITVPEDVFVPEEPAPLPPPSRDADEGQSGGVLPAPAEPAPPAPVGEEAGLATEPAPVGGGTVLEALADETPDPAPMAPSDPTPSMAPPDPTPSMAPPDPAPMAPPEPTPMAPPEPTPVAPPDPAPVALREPAPVAPPDPEPVEPLPPALEDLPVIPLRPLENAAPEHPAPLKEPVAPAEVPDPRVQPLAEDLSSVPSAPSGRDWVSDGDADPDEPVRLPGLVTAALQWTTVLGIILSRGLAPINRLEQGLPLFGFDVPSPAPLDSHSSPAGEISLPSFGLDLDAARSRTSTALRELPARTRGWLDGLASRVSTLRRERPQPEPASFEEPPAPPAPASLRTRWLDGITSRVSALRPERPQSTPVPAEEPTSASPPVSPRPTVRQPPPAASELPALRLAPIPQPRERGDVYAGDGGGGVGPVVRLWTQRFFLTATLLAGAALAGLHWDAWSPAAGSVGGTIFNQIDDRVRWWHLARERQAVIDRASDQLPHLARDTVSLILSTNRTHVLEPPVVFETAWGAAQRGVTTLTASELAELEALRQELLEGLPPLDRERLRTFGQAHARGAVFPFDARRGLLAYARGVRGLPPQRRERLQTLLGKAVAAGLAS